MNYIVYDLEASCWDGSPSGLVQETIEIGAFRLNEYAEITGEYNRFIKPIVHPFLSPFCKELTSITQENVDRARKFPEVIAEFLDWVGVDEEEYLLCSWGSFDKKMFAKDCELHRLDSDWTEKHINLKSQYQKIKRLHRPYGMKKALNKEGFEFTGTQHRGIDDAENLVKLFLKYFDEWERLH